MRIAQLAGALTPHWGERLALLAALGARLRGFLDFVRIAAV